MNVRATTLMLILIDPVFYQYIHFIDSSIGLRFHKKTLFVERKLTSQFIYVCTRRPLACNKCWFLAQIAIWERKF